MTFAPLLLATLATSAQPAPTLRLTDALLAPRVEESLQVHDDPAGALKLEEVAGAEVEFLPYAEAPRASRDTRWLRLRLENASKRADWMLEFRDTRIDEITLFSPRPGGGFDSARCGDLLDFAARPLPTPRCIFPLNLEPGETRTFLARVRTGFPIELFPTLMTSPTAHQRMGALNFVIGGYVGMALVMALYNLLLWVTVRGRSHLHYSLYAAGLGLNALIIFGLAHQYLWPSSPVLANWALPLVNALTAWSAIAFARSFLELQGTGRRFDKLLLGAQSVFVALVLASPLLGAPRAMVAISIAILLSVLLLAVAGVNELARGSRQAKFFLAAWAFLLLGIVVNHLGGIGVLPSNAWTSRAYLAGSGVEMVLLSLGLADRINTLRRARDRAETEATIAGRLRHFFPHKLVARILDAPEDVRLNTQRQTVTLLFSDLAGFTAFTDRTEPGLLARILNEYLAEMVRIIEAHGGTLDKVMGDGIMAAWGAADQMDLDEQARCAVRAGLAMQERLETLGQTWRAGGLEHSIKMRIGIHQDEVTVGTFGTEELMSFTSIGSGVNLASRLESSCTPGRVQVSDAVLRRIGMEFPFEPMQEKQLKGFSTPHRVCEIDPKKARTPARPVDPAA